MSDQYYLLSKGKVNGPFALAQPAEAGAARVVLHSDEISMDRRTWVPATQYTGLFSTTSAVGPAQPLPAAIAPPAALPPTASSAASGPAGAVSPPKVQMIGRDFSCDLVLDLPAVSARHLSVNTTTAGVYATDLGSASGTYVNGRD